MASTTSQLVDEDEIEEPKVALVLGTSRYRHGGGINKFFEERMETAAQLFHHQKTHHLLVSGDNSSQFYNEPRQMVDALENLSIDQKDITMDFAGFRTFDSIMRSKYVFGQDSIIIVTQQFHCYRALFIANYFNIHAVAIPSGKNDAIGLKLILREIIARSLAVADLYIIQREPKFLGDKVDVPN